MGSTLATKQDIRLLEQKLEQKIELLQSSMTIRLGSILVSWPWACYSLR
jgi:hypothetical protein